MRARLAAFAAGLRWEDVWYYLFMTTLFAWDLRELIPNL